MKATNFRLLLCFCLCLFLILKDAMRKAEAAGNNDCPVKIKLVAPPLYVLTTQTLDKVSTTSFVLEGCYNENV